MVRVPKANQSAKWSMPIEPLPSSIVIANFNFGSFVGRAIQSALDLDWPAVEIAVVDDGSTDESASIIRSFGDTIQTTFQNNAGQRETNNVGFACASGEVIVFLDADDILEPEFAREVAAVWRQGVSKVQVQMRRVDANERPFGRLLLPIANAPQPVQVRVWAVLDSEYSTPPGSGNAYSRAFLSVFFPIDPKHDSSTDSTCLALAPPLGDVLTIAKPRVCHRQHGANDSNLFAGPGRFAGEITRAMTRQQSVELILKNLDRTLPSTGRPRRSRQFLQLRIDSLRTQRERHPLPEDGYLAALTDAIRSIFGSSFYPGPKSALMAKWGIVTLLAPRPLARRLINMRFLTGTRYTTNAENAISRHGVAAFAGSKAAGKAKRGTPLGQLERICDDRHCLYRPLSNDDPASSSWSKC